MRPPRCEKHRRLVLDLALGLLDDDTAEHAETVRTTCPTCRDWWAAELANEDAAIVAAAVSQGLRSFQAPRVRRQHWYAIAAAAVLALAVGLLWQLGPGHAGSSLGTATTTAAVTPGPVHGPGKLINSFSFESGEGASLTIVNQQAPATTRHATQRHGHGQPLSSAGFEDGSLSGLRPVT